jgi:hypothetical protein
MLFNVYYINMEAYSNCMEVGAVTTLATTESVFAYQKNQAISQVIECSSGELARNVGC